MKRSQTVPNPKEAASTLAALDKSQAIIEFEMDGTILTANANFLGAMGYSLSEIQGEHHRMFVEPEYGNSLEYKDFWARLGRGEFQSAQYKRLGKGGREVWIEASYNPVFDKRGRPYKVVKFATDITAQKLQNADYLGQINAINNSQAVIHFNLDGTILTANQNFLNTLGYSLEEIKGKHHRMFVEGSYGDSQDYRDFWARLNRGEFQSGEYKRLGKGGREVWILASYNPILDMNGKPFKVVKYASDISGQMSARNEAGELVTQSHLNVQTVAAAIEELTASIGEISKNMALSQSAVNDIVGKTTVANEACEALQRSSHLMESVVSLISNIANQVNLLALNATIEAARAGDAGKGFAVVAAEVKNLASQTGRATSEIKKEITEMQAVSQNVAASVSEIGSTTSSVSLYVSGVASAIEEQSVVTREISNTMQQTAVGISTINQCIQTITKAA